jgi:hypothetical protein
MTKIDIKVVLGHTRQKWEFLYHEGPRVLSLISYKKFLPIGETWVEDVVIEPAKGDDEEEMLEKALGPRTNREKVLYIALARCLEADFYMGVNDVHGIQLRWGRLQP